MVNKIIVICFLLAGLSASADTVTLNDKVHIEIWDVLNKAEKKFIEIDVTNSNTDFESSFEKLWETLEISRKTEIENKWISSYLESDEGFEEFWKCLTSKEKKKLKKEYKKKGISKDEAFENFWKSLSSDRINEIANTIFEY